MKPSSKKGPTSETLGRSIRLAASGGEVRRAPDANDLVQLDPDDYRRGRVTPATETSPERSAFLFPTTHWTTLLQPIHQRSELAQSALNRLFEIYRRPILTYVSTLVRHPQHAEDIAQDFISRILSRDDLANTDRNKGRFRSYLATSIRHFVISHYAAEDAAKRKQLNQAIPLEETGVEPGSMTDPEKEFTRQWWRATIDESVRRLRAEWAGAGKLDLFDDLEPLLWSRQDGLSVNEIAVRHKMTPNAVSLRKLRMGDRFREILVMVLQETVGSTAEVEAEIRFLLQDP